MPAPRRRRMLLETRLALVSLAGGLPAILFLSWTLERSRADSLTRATVYLLAGFVWIACALVVRERVVRPLRTLSNMLGALREGDTSIRARGADPRGALGFALYELNEFADDLRRQRLDAREATALLQRVMDSIEVAVVAFDEAGELRLANRHAEELLGRTAERVIGSSAEALGLAETLSGETPRLVDLRLEGRAGRWELRRGEYRQDGRPHQLVVLSDLTRALREEEREAWMRLVRVLSHEINNSLAPIQSIAGSLHALLGKPAPSADALADARQGLEVVEARARSLGRFMNQYAQLARLPKPRLSSVDVAAWVRRVAALETRLAVEVAGGPEIHVSADGDQLDQLLINLVQNATDAALETGGGVRVRWRSVSGAIEVEIEDDGAGLADTANLFVPFFTTKPEGSGIGLAISRQIAEAHGGGVTLTNRHGARGCVATVRLPRRAPRA